MKKKTSVTLDERLVRLIEESAKKENRSISQEIEKRLMDYYDPSLLAKKND